MTRRFNQPHWLVQNLYKAQNTGYSQTLVNTATFGVDLLYKSRNLQTSHDFTYSSYYSRCLISHLCDWPNVAGLSGMHCI